MTSAKNISPAPAASALPDHLRGLTEKEQAFVRARARGASISDAAKAASYSHVQNGYAAEHREHVRKALDIEFELARISEGPALWRKLMALTGAEKDETALKATTASLDRIGLGPGRTLEVRHTGDSEAATPKQRLLAMAEALKAAPPDQKLFALSLAQELPEPDRSFVLQHAGLVDGGKLIVDAHAEEVEAPANPKPTSADVGDAESDDGEPSDEKPPRLSADDQSTDEDEIARQLRQLGIEPDALADDESEGSANA